MKKILLIHIIFSSCLPGFSQDQKSDSVIASTRVNSTIYHSPPRVEILDAKKVEAEVSIQPAHVAGLLGKLTAVQPRQTSAVTGNTDIRIQGLPGGHTQLLRDGMPLFGGYASSFSFLQVPPLDLKQIEIIKGPGSALYGGGAVAGLVNMISKKPVAGVKERYLLLNQSTRRETNINIYLSERDRKFGYTFFGGITYQGQSDVNEDGFSDVAATENFFIHPTIYFYPNQRNTFSLGINSIFEDRRGGDMRVLNGRPSGTHRFFIENQSYRNTLDASWEKKIGEADRFTVKGGSSAFNRNITTNVFGMRARQMSWFAEAAYLKKKVKHDLVGGINLKGEVFKKRLPDSSTIDNYNHITPGIFVQDDWRIHSRFLIQSGLRADYHTKYGTFILPRLSLLYRISSSLNTRLGGGLGYKIPTVFSSEVDERMYARMQLDEKATAERSAGVNWDIHFKKLLGEVELAVNPSFFFTRVSRPLVALVSPGQVLFYSETQPVTTKGLETWVELRYKKLEAYLGYTFTDARKDYDEVQPYLEFSVRNKFAAVISYAFLPHFRGTVETVYTGSQYLEAGKKSPSFPLIATMLGYDVGRCSFVLNIKNLLDYRQTRKENILILPTINPTFKQLWAPIDGRVVNLSLKVSL